MGGIKETIKDPMTRTIYKKILEKVAGDMAGILFNNTKTESKDFSKGVGKVVIGFDWKAINKDLTDYYIGIEKITQNG